MKNAKFFSYLLIIVSTSIFAGCTQESTRFGDTAREAITNAQWSVHYYFSVQDRTAEFSNYQFSFTGDGTVTVADGTNTIRGTWDMVTGVNRNEVLRINISEAHLQGLNDQWTVNMVPDGSLNMHSAAREMRLKKL